MAERNEINSGGKKPLGNITTRNQLNNILSLSDQLKLYEKLAEQLGFKESEEMKKIRGNVQKNLKKQLDYLNRLFSKDSTSLEEIHQEDIEDTAIYDTLCKEIINGGKNESEKTLRNIGYSFIKIVMYGEIGDEAAYSAAISDLEILLAEHGVDEYIIPLLDNSNAQSIIETSIDSTTILMIFSELTQKIRI